MAQPTDSSVNKTAHAFERASLESLLIRRFFFAPAFEIYGGEPSLPLVPVVSCTRRCAEY